MQLESLLQQPRAKGGEISRSAPSFVVDQLLLPPTFPLPSLKSMNDDVAFSGQQLGNDDVYLAFSEHLRGAQSGEVSLLDEDDGLIVRWGAICQAK